MAAPKTHFLHPEHELKHRGYHMPRICDVCGEQLTGSGYSCRRRLCDFDLHEECATFPEVLSSFFVHPWHDLTLSRTADDDGAPPLVCHVCREAVPAGACMYRCAPCGFDMHPRCSRLPRAVRSELHPEHSLAAVSGMGTCAACGEPCYVWVYRCGPCNVDLHIGCLHGARPPPKGTGGQAGSSQDAGKLVGSIVEVGASLVKVLESNNN